MVDIDKDRLAGAPRYGADEDPFADDEYGARLDIYYRTTPTPHRRGIPLHELSLGHEV